MGFILVMELGHGLFLSAGFRIIVRLQSNPDLRRLYLRETLAHL